MNKSGLLHKFKLLIQMPNISISLLVGLAVFAFSEFFYSDEWQSTMIISVNDSESHAESLAEINLNPFTQTDGNSLKIESFLMSNEGIASILEYAKKIGGEDLLTPNKLDLLKIFKEESQVLRSLISIKKIEGSNMLEISSRAFDANSARIINLSIINLSINFFGIQKNLKSQLNYANNVCILKLLVENLTTDSDISILSMNELKNNQMIGSREMLRNVYEKYAENCTSKNNNNIEGSKLASLPSGLLDSLDASFRSQLIQEIYRDYNQNLQQRNIVEIIADPDLPLNEVPKRSFILMIVAILICSLSFISIKGLLSIWRDYS